MYFKKVFLTCILILTILAIPLVILITAAYVRFSLMGIINRDMSADELLAQLALWVFLAIFLILFLIGVILFIKEEIENIIKQENIGKNVQNKIELL